MLSALLLLGGLALALGLLLGYAAVRFEVEGDPVSDLVDRLLPQSQCGQCGYPGCRPYAEAVTRGNADIDQCVPGGEATMRLLADLLGKDVKPLDPEAVTKLRAVAIIDEALCIGCTLCMQACPVDAIVGAAKHMHTVIVRECTGCELCVPVCPIDCIRMEPLRIEITTWKWPDPEKQTAPVDEA